MKHLFNFLAIGLVAIGAFILGFHNVGYIVEKDVLQETGKTIPLGLIGGAAVILGIGILFLNAKKR